MQHAYAILSAASLAPPNISTLSHKRHDFRKKKLVNIICVLLFSLQLLFEILLTLRRIQRDVVINVKTSSCKVPVIAKCSYTFSEMSYFYDLEKPQEIWRPETSFAVYWDSDL